MKKVMLVITLAALLGGCANVGDTMQDVATNAQTYMPLLGIHL